MRKLFTILSAMLLTAIVWAQIPQKMSYQAVIRNSSGLLVTNQVIGMEINIRQGSPTGTVVYTETQTPTTNANGMVSIEIGGGAGFSTINWASNTYFIETKTAVVAPLTIYTITGTSQLLSVPYALYAKTAENSFSGNYNDLTNKPLLSNVATSGSYVDLTNKPLLSNVATSGSYIDLINKPIIDGSETKVTAGTNVTVTGSGTTANPYVINSTAGGSVTHYLGEEYLGGIIYYLSKDSAGVQKGLIVSKTESTTAVWSGTTLIGANNTSNGISNMNLMPTGAGTARTWVETLGAGWYLPSIDELSLLWHNRFHVNNSSASGLSLLSATFYWSSTEYGPTGAFLFNINGTLSINNKTNPGGTTRAIRAF